jgi:hypothetical protein
MPKRYLRILAESTGAFICRKERLAEERRRRKRERWRPLGLGSVLVVVGAGVALALLTSVRVVAFTLCLRPVVCVCTRNGAVKAGGTEAVPVVLRP